MNLSAFLAENAESVENVKHVVSSRFKDENGEPIPWVIRVISSEEDERLRRLCRKQVQIPGKKNVYVPQTDYDSYAGKLAAACTVEPNLNDTTLQDSYHVMGAENLLKAMLTAGEYASYVNKVQEVCGFDQTFQDEVDEAKNL